MQRRRQLEVTKRVVVATANMLGVGLDALVAQPGADLGVADAEGIRALGNGHGVTDVVAVTVRDEDVVRVNLLRLERGCRITAEVRVDHQAAIADF